ncbi:uncharacterized protein PITG_16456 [Phytophthora infestans T30-4]|uniref:Uncharacterized protein n=1 Tax=Phytophthora infestans (strain T30-4) TaxID=403677 RepID=D0NTN9_PHYIT|nr:uncharacterized protein PITG_16456 [Phytophthora infestans T30-4]EEY65001.1 conserved hypothetical protein [Phytophthora infestans T30-4]|eukprot:XP_002897489.1 conserved hypothetical protein [Phytophthora infestans T30-4]
MQGHHASDVLYAKSEVSQTPDPLAGEPTDRHGIPLSVAHSPQTDLPVWQFIHKLTTPLSNPKSGDHPYTHICVLCSASPPMRATSKRTVTWRDALMRQRMSTNAVAHMQRVHPDEFVTIADYKQRKREALVEKAANGPNEPKKKRAKRTPGPKKKSATTPDENREVSPRKRTPGKTTDHVRTWLISSGLPVSVLQDASLQQLLKLSNSAISALTTASTFNAQVQEEFIKFSGFLDLYLASESQAALGLPFLSLRHEFRPIDGATAEDGARDDVVSNQEKAFLSVAVGFIDSQWRRVDLVLAAKQVPRSWSQQVNQLVTQTVSDTYGIPSISKYARFHVDVVEASPSSLAVSEGYEASTDEHEDVLTRTLRHCVVDALGVGPTSSFGGETSVRRLVRLLQELLTYFEAPDRANMLTEIGARNALLRVSCCRYRAYCLYFQSSMRPTVAEPELETAWTQLSMDDWQTVTEIEAILNHLTQFRLEERVALRPGAVAPSYALLFRRLLSVTVSVSSLKCLSLEDDAAVGSSSEKWTARRKAKRVDMFTSTGRQCMEQLRELITQHLASPTSVCEVDDEIKAMLLDPRISSKAGDLVSDTRVLRRAQEALRQEHRAMSSLLMVDGPKNQPPAAASTTSSGRRSSDAVAEDEARAWREWQQVYVAWDTLASEGADLFDKGQYNLLKLYHHVDILKWFREVGQQAHPAASLLARVYLGQQRPPSRALGTSLLQFTKQEEADWVTGAIERAEKRCILHYNWRQYQQLSADGAVVLARDEGVKITTI